MDREQVGGMFKRYFKPVRRWLNQQGVVGSEIDDLAMEVFIRLLRYDSKDMVNNPGGYVFTVAGNVAHEWRRLWRVSKPHDDCWLEDLEDLEDSYKTIEQEELQAYVAKLFKELLTTRQQQILYMHVYDKLTYKEIALELGITQRMVLRELTKSYSAFRFRVTEDGMKQ